MEARAETYVKGKMRSARRIPYWLWIIIARMLGIKLSEGEKPIISAVMHIATFGSAAGTHTCIYFYKTKIFLSFMAKFENQG